MLSLDEIIFDQKEPRYSRGNERFISVTEAIDLSGFGPDFSKVNPDRLEHARKKGTFVHQACQYYDEGTLDMGSLVPELRGYVEAYIKFRKECNVRVISIEKQMLSKIRCCWNSETSLGHKCFHLAGTLDRIYWMSDSRVLVDLKSSQSMSNSMGLQTSGYSFLWNALFPTTPVYLRAGLQLRKNGTYKFVPHNNSDDHFVFRECFKLASAKVGLSAVRSQYA